MEVTEVTKISGVAAVTSEMSVARPVSAVQSALKKRAARNQARREKSHVELALQAVISSPSDLGNEVDTLA